MEYEAGLAAAGLSAKPSDPVRQALTARLQGAREQLQPVQAAAAAASRNGWLAGLISVVGVVLICVLRRG